MIAVSDHLRDEMLAAGFVVVHYRDATWVATDPSRVRIQLQLPVSAEGADRSWVVLTDALGLQDRFVGDPAGRPVAVV